jgi:uncharacterized LabA/DUF88 family protein
MNGSVNNDADVALFIDWENFKISLAVGHRMPNVSALKEEAANHGRVVIAKAYADWVARAPELRGASQFINDPPALYAAGIEPVYVPTQLPGGTPSSPQLNRRVRVKNSVDVKMTADCIETSHSYSNIGTYILVSGDSDFIHVVNTLRAMGKRVIIIGVSWSTSRRLADQVDGLILYDTDVDPITPQEFAPEPNSTMSPHDIAPGKRELPEIIKAIEEIVHSERQAGSMPLLTSIKQRLMRRFTGFDEKKLGFAGFKKLMVRAAQEGHIKLTTAGLVDWAIMSDEPDHWEVSPESPPASRSPSRRGRQEKPTPEKLPSVSNNDGIVATIPGSEQKAKNDKEALAEDEITAHDLTAVTAKLNLPKGSMDGHDEQRVADLIVMADALETREGISHVAFSFLVNEICHALDQGLKASHEEITQRWSQVYSRTYITKMVRGLSNENLFELGWHTWRDQANGRHRRRALNLNRANSVVQQVLNSRVGQSSESEAEPANAQIDAIIQGNPADGEEISPLARYTMPLIRLFRPNRE